MTLGRAQERDIHVGFFGHQKTSEFAHQSRRLTSYRFWDFFFNLRFLNIYLKKFLPKYRDRVTLGRAQERDVRVRFFYQQATSELAHQSWRFAPNRLCVFFFQILQFKENHFCLFLPK